MTASARATGGRRGPAPLPWQLTLPGNRPQMLTANGRVHWRVRAARTRYWRSIALLHARSLLATGTWHRLDQARIEIRLDWPDQRRRDPANWAPTAKAIVDGLVDAGLIPDDDHRHLIGPDLRRGLGPHAIHLTITDLAPIDLEESQP